MDLTAVFIAIGPEVHSVDIAVREPEGAMVRMILRTAFFHGVRPGEIGPGGSNDGIEVGPLGTGTEVLGEDLPIQQHADAGLGALGGQKGCGGLAGGGRPSQAGEEGEGRIFHGG